jgi:hypothetical protein
VLVKLDLEFVDWKAQANALPLKESLLRDPVAKECAWLQRRRLPFDGLELAACKVAPGNGEPFDVRLDPLKVNADLASVADRDQGATLGVSHVEGEGAAVAVRCVKRRLAVRAR